jgi:hypothetical protein
MNKLERLARDLVSATLRAIGNIYDMDVELSDSNIILEINALLDAYPKINAEELAMLFHKTYERMAPDFGYETRKETRSFDNSTPNGQLMIAVCKEVLKILQIPEPTESEA